MSPAPSAATSVTSIPAGRWEIEPSGGGLGFRARGMFGLAGVTGAFAAYDGELIADSVGLSGELRIQATTLDTGNDRRDTHLRSSDFFDVDTHPTITFTLTDIAPGSDGALQVTGVMKIRESALPITAPVTVERDGEKLHLRTAISVDRAAAGVGWSKLGMIKGPAHLDAHVVLNRHTDATLNS